MISIGSVAPNRNDIAPIKGVIPTSVTWDQYIPIVDDDGTRLDLTDYTVELVFSRRGCRDANLRLSTVTGEILKTTDGSGDTTRVFVSPATMASMCGDYCCEFRATDTTEQIWLLAQGIVTFTPGSAAFA